MKANIVCDDYKEEAFKKVLTKNGFEFTVHPGITKDTRQILVVYEQHQLEGLAMIVKEANNKKSR
jgi:hypothetical protein